MRTFVLFQFVFLLFLCSCKKTEREIVYFPDELKQYSVFNVGSYWIYQNDKTGNEDSTYLLSQPEFYFSYYGETGPKEENLNCDYGGNFIKYVFSRPNDEGTGYFLKHYFYGFGGISLISGHIEKGFTQQSKLYFYSFKVLSINDTVVIKTNKYTNVITTQYMTFPPGSHDTTKCTYYLNKSYGLIKVNYSINGHDTTWNLMRSHVVR